MRLSEITLHEVGFRDGLQMEPETYPTEVKLGWIGSLLSSGLDVIQLGSFVHPKLVPQMAVSDLLFKEARQMRTGRTPLFSGLVLNEKGLERGLDCGVEMFCMGVSASETHSRKNTRMSVEEALSRIIPMAQSVLTQGFRVQLSVQSAFGCGYEGNVPQDRVLGIVQRYLDGGLDEISLADTAGHADPLSVRLLIQKVKDCSQSLRLTCHFHNTFGLALANCYAALEEGVDCLESSVAGLGGCPFTAVAGGNACTEDLVHMMQRMGLRPDVQLATIIKTAGDVAIRIGHDLPGSVYRAGPIPTSFTDGGT
jgi:hydroxymethylglutaryl-CoA lyase